MAAGVDESVLAALMPGGKYDIAANWRLRLKFKRDRGNKNVTIYTLDRAVLEIFRKTVDYTWEMKSRAGQVLFQTRPTATARGRALSRKECDLELAVNLRKKTYAITGKLEVLGIPDEGETGMDIRIGVIRHRQQEGEEGTEEIDEDIDISGTFSDEKPARLEGTRDEMAELPSEFQEFFQALAGKVDFIFFWDLKKKKRD
jgi:hypothetical protein